MNMHQHKPKSNKSQLLKEILTYTEVTFNASFKTGVHSEEGGHDTGGKNDLESHCLIRKTAENVKKHKKQGLKMIIVIADIVFGPSTSSVLI